MVGHNDSSLVQGAGVHLVVDGDDNRDDSHQPADDVLDLSVGGYAVSREQAAAVGQDVAQERVPLVFVEVHELEGDAPRAGGGPGVDVIAARVRHRGRARRGGSEAVGVGCQHELPYSPRLDTAAATDAGAAAPVDLGDKIDGRGAGERNSGHSISCEILIGAKRVCHRPIRGRDLGRKRNRRCAYSGLRTSDQLGPG